MDLQLVPRFTEGGIVSQISNGWQLRIDSCAHRRYCLAQLDDYKNLKRRNFLWRPPLMLHLQARASHPGLPGTWGFGFWNDPFGLSLGFGPSKGRLPVLPNAVWFFHASVNNYLSLRDDLPANGLLASSYKSLSWPFTLLIPFIIGLPLLLIRPFAKWLRAVARQLVLQDATSFELDETDWHDYTIQWFPDRVCFVTDGEMLLDTALTPRGPLALVLWIDNQYAAFTPQGRLAWGTLDVAESIWLEIKNISIKTGKK